MLLKRSLRATSMRDWSSVRPSTINFSRDTKMWKKRLRISRILKGSSLRKLMEAVKCLKLLECRDKWEVWCKVVECPNLLMEEAEWEALVTLLRSHHICEWFIPMDLFLPLSNYTSFIMRTIFFLEFQFPNKTLIINILLIPPFIILFWISEKIQIFLM